MEILKIENLAFRYPNTEFSAIHNISLRVNEGDFVVLCGKSGCGKTTLLRLIKRELEPHGYKEGTIWFDGELLENLTNEKAATEIGFVMQNPENQIVMDKVWHELAFGLESLGLPNDIMKRRIAEMANYFGIHTWYHKNTYELSGGQKQLLNLASVMVMKPKLLILDEPSSQLDPIASFEFISTLHKINEELGITIIMSEHHLEEVLSFATKVAVLEAGELIAYDKPKNILKCLVKLKKEELIRGLPSAVRIFHALSKKEECPLTVKEGREFLSKHFLAEDKKTMIGKEQIDKKKIDIEKTVIGNINTEKKDTKNGESKKKGAYKKYTEKKDKGKRELGKRKIGLKDTDIKEVEMRNEEKKDTDMKEAFIKSKNTLQSNSIIEMKNVWFRYEQELPDILTSVNIDISEGEIFTIIGGNGSGKTTLLRVIAGLNYAYSGRVKIAGKRIEKYKKGELYHNLIAYLPQNPQAMFIKQTVYEDYMEIRKVTQLRKEKFLEEIDKIANNLEIRQLLYSHPYDLSGGEQQKVALGKLLLLHPKILLLDEPTKGLDAFSKQTLAGLLENLSLEGKTIVMVTHDIEFAAEVSTRCGLFFDGNVMSVDDGKEFFKGNTFYTTAANRIARQVIDDVVTCQDVINFCLACER